MIRNEVSVVFDAFIAVTLYHTIFQQIPKTHAMECRAISLNPPAAAELTANMLIPGN